MQNSDHWDRQTIDFLRPHLESTTSLLQISTGFFTIQGFDLIRGSLNGIRIQLMVGFDEYGKERLNELLVSDIMEYLSRWDINDRRTAVLDLVRKMQNGHFQIVENSVEARVKKRDHGKLYIFDSKKALCGSANLTYSGLKHNSENLTLVIRPEGVSYYCNKFIGYWEADNILDLTQLLLNALLAWLELRPPFDIYLKTIEALVKEDPVAPPRANYKMPNKFQKVVIERILRQLKSYRGAMLVASTGLGKTIMATHTALRLRRDSQIDNVIIFAPISVHHEWKATMKSAGISAEIFSRALLDRPDGRGAKMLALRQALEDLDEKYLIIFDESQRFRNRTRASDGLKKHSFNRLGAILKSKKPKVLLLTATPYSKGVSDLNNQLLLLPHTAEKEYIEESGQFVMQGFKDDSIAPQSWKVIESQDFFAKFLKLPVATVISTSQVAKDFATSEEEGDSLFFGTQKKWIPKVAVTKIKVPVFLEKEMTEAISKNVFKHKPHKVSKRNNKEIWSPYTILNKAQVAWMSSPGALNEVIEKSISGEYKVRFIRPEEQRKAILLPILEQIKKFDYSKDPKFQALVLCLKRFYEEGRKVIIFTERLVTATYLEELLRKRLSYLKIANTVKKTPTGKSELKDFEKEVLTLIKNFAPEANADKFLPREKRTDYDLLIATDAYSTGVNLQDASVVIHYDLAWTPDVLIQRAGRVLRFWKNPRKVHFLIFVGTFEEHLVGKQKTHSVEKRLRLLSTRTKEAQKFSEIPILPEGDSADYDSLAALSSVTIEDLGLVEAQGLEEFQGISPYLRHITALKDNEDYSKGIPIDISSARVYPGKKLLIYLLMKNQETYFYVLFDWEKQCILPTKEDDLLDLLCCTLQTPTANIQPELIEQYAQQTRIFWKKSLPVALQNDNSFERICALILIPKNREVEGFLKL